MRCHHLAMYAQRGHQVHIHPKEKIFSLHTNLGSGVTLSLGYYLPKQGSRNKYQFRIDFKFHVLLFFVRYNGYFSPYQIGNYLLERKLRCTHLFYDLTTELLTTHQNKTLDEIHYYVLLCVCADHTEMVLRMYSVVIIHCCMHHF